MKDTIINSSKIKILVCCHKPCELPEDDIFLPIQVGAAISDVDLGMQRDDQVNGITCDNISAKNKSYCELTAMYWAWKNIKKLYPDLEYIGLNHYRRYFAFDKQFIKKELYVNLENSILKYKIKKNRMEKLLKKGKTIIAKKKVYPYPLYLDYSLSHISEDLRTLKKIIQDKTPDYIPAFNRVFMRNNALAHYNMTVIMWTHFDNYCSWLFDILQEAEQRINIQNYSDFQKRIFGYMAERLFNVWLIANKIDVKEIPVVQYADNVTELSFVKYFYRRIRFSISNIFLKQWRKKN